MDIPFYFYTNIIQEVALSNGPHRMLTLSFYLKTKTKTVSETQYILYFYGEDNVQRNFSSRLIDNFIK
jgi:hypothetical protein